MEKYKIITVDISECLSTTVELEVPKDFNVDDTEALKHEIEEQVTLPSELILRYSQDSWFVDDFSCIPW